MIPRKKLDIGWSDLIFAASTGLRPRGAAGLVEVQRGVEGQLGPADEFLACLSVRSGFDLLLETLALPHGSEVLVSAINIKDMGRIVRAHGLVPVPVDLDMDRLGVRMEALHRALSHRSRVLLVAHLFGSRMELEEVSRFARDNDLLLVEDCAQAFTGPRACPPPESDVVMFSFGPIKTHTSLGGALLRVRDGDLLKRMRAAETRRPRQPVGEFTRRALQYLAMNGILTDPAYATFTAVLRGAGTNHDEVIGASVRGFPGPDFFQRIRRRPSGALLSTMLRRLSRFDPRVIEDRARRGAEVLARLPGVTAPGRQALSHTHWVVPVLVDEPDRRMRELWDHGLDATRGATSIAALRAPDGRPDTDPSEARCAMDRMLFLPVYPEAHTRHMDRLVEAVARWPRVELREAIHA